MFSFSSCCKLTHHQLGCLKRNERCLFICNYLQLTLLHFCIISTFSHPTPQRYHITATTTTIRTMFWNTPQKVSIPPTCDYSNLASSLPDPPKNQRWEHNETTKEWKLVPSIVDDGTEAKVQAADEGVPVTSSSSCIYHKVLPTDTFQGICLRYKVTATDLRRANKMMGTNLKLAPSNLLIPIKGGVSKLDQKQTKELTTEQKIAAILSATSTREEGTKKLGYSEARAYLELNDGDLNGAITNAKEDLGWSSSTQMST